MAEPAEVTMKLTDTKQRLSQIVNRVARGEERVVVEKSGLAVAAIISVEEYRRFQSFEANRASRLAALERLSRAFDDIPTGEIDRYVQRAIDEVRNDSGGTIRTDAA